jgi:ubiquinone/menaquinone biosynthesis C-methylase UbiE
MLKQYSYNKLAKYYDIIELKAENPHSKSNLFIESVLKKNNVKSVLDFTAGTGAQALYLSNHFNVVASDLNKGMLDIAKEKAQKEGRKISFSQGDIKHTKLGKFDAVITIFNAIGHLSENEFDLALGNINDNLKDGGIYIFDIFNEDFMKSGGAIKHEFIDVALEQGGTKFVRFNHNKIDFKKGVMRINQEILIQKGLEKPYRMKENWDMQIYTADKLVALLRKNNFKVLHIYGGWGMKFDRQKSLSIVVIAQKLS